MHSDQWSNPQPKYVSWPRVEPATFWCMRWSSILLSLIGQDLSSWVSQQLNGCQVHLMWSLQIQALFFGLTIESALCTIIGKLASSTWLACLLIMAFVSPCPKFENWPFSVVLYSFILTTLFSSLLFRKSATICYFCFALSRQSSPAVAYYSGWLTSFWDLPSGT